jgi:hypothetical protein
MRRSGILFLSFAVLSVTGAMAQDLKWEFSAKADYTLSNGVDADKLAVEGTNQEVVRIAPKSGPSWGLQLDYLAFEHVSFGFL